MQTPAKSADSLLAHGLWYFDAQRGTPAAVIRNVLRKVENNEGRIESTVLAVLVDGLLAKPLPDLPEWGRRLDLECNFD
ncbi:MAG: hypothetical protein ACJ8EL_16780 [Rhizomicrobium sp.]